METEVGPHNISIFEFLLNDHHAQIKSTQQDLFRRSTFLHHGNRSLLTLKSNIVQSKHDHYHYLDLNPWPQDSDSPTEARSSRRALPDNGTSEMEIFLKNISQLSVLPISTSTPTKYGASFKFSAFHHNFCSSEFQNFI